MKEGFLHVRLVPFLGPIPSMYTPYFIAGVIRSAEALPDDVEQAVLTEWLCSLVEREALLNYQCTLTDTLLTVAPDHPLLSNLPFAVNSLIRLKVRVHC